MRFWHRNVWNGHPMKYIITLFLFVAGVHADQYILLQTGSAAGGGGSGGTNTWVTGQTLGTLRNDYTGQVGLQMIPATNMTITALGVYVVAGGTNSNTVYLYDTNGVILTQVFINYSGLSGWTYTNTTWSVTAGTTYYVMFGAISGDGDFWYSDDTSIAVTSAASCLGSTLSAPGSIHVSGNYSYGPVSFKYTIP